MCYILLTFLFVFCAQILFLNLFSKIDMDAVRLLRHLQPLADVMNKTSQLLPELFTQVSGMENPQKQEDTVLREWEMESVPFP